MVSRCSHLLYLVCLRLSSPPRLITRHQVVVYSKSRGNQWQQMSVRCWPSEDRPGQSYSNTALLMELQSSVSTQSDIWEIDYPRTFRQILVAHYPLKRDKFYLYANELRDGLAIRYRRKAVSMPRRCYGCGKNDFNLDYALTCCCKIGGLIPQTRN